MAGHNSTHAACTDPRLSGLGASVHYSYSYRRSIRAIHHLGQGRVGVRVRIRVRVRLRGIMPVTQTLTVWAAESVS